MNWHTTDVAGILKHLGSSEKGLDGQTVQQKLAQYGKNELATKKKINPVLIFARQFVSVMILVLVAAAIISAFIGEVSDTIVIVCIIVLNGIIGFVQEYRAEKAIEALQKMAAPAAQVFRDNKLQEVAATDIVPGDIVMLNAGQAVPADLRLIEIKALKLNEASLTGESHTIEKSTAELKEENIPLGERLNMAYMGTQVTSGNAKGIVVATGMKTELGKIAHMLEKAKSDTPLQKRLSQFSKWLTIVILLLCTVLFFLGWLSGQPFNEMLLTSISLAVAAIPEALPAVVTISLALGAKNLVRQHALIRKLYAVETLGSVTYICTDKTGTLTRNEMEVKDLWTAEENRKEELLQAMRVNHDVKQENDQFMGDPTEVAIVQYAKEKPDLKRINEIPFDSERKAMTTIHERDGKLWVVTKGAPEAIAAIVDDGGFVTEIKKAEEEMAARGMRVLGFAGKMLNDLPKELTPASIETGMEFLGLVGLIDPPREEVKQAIAECKQAGVVPVMITGDHPLTAAYIAKELGIIENENQKVLTGREMEEKGTEYLKAEATNIRAYARVSPEQKINIIEALQENKQFVAMTGDGVNDAPSIKKANIGIAMGKIGTEVTKEAAQMILMDDHFETIVKAIKAGRRVYGNIRKFIKYILTGNAAEIWLIFSAPLLGLPIPLLPVHILWINLVTDGLPAIALAAEPADADAMKQPPRPPNESIFAKGVGVHILWVSIFIALLNLGTQWYMLDKSTHWQTMVFSVLCFCQLWHVLAIRSDKTSLFRQGLFSNTPLLLAVLATVALQFAIIYVPFLNKFFHTQPLTLNEVLLAIGISSLTFVAVEIEKMVKRMRSR